VERQILAGKRKEAERVAGRGLDRLDGHLPLLRRRRQRQVGDRVLGRDPPGYLKSILFIRLSCAYFTYEP
jgi:hypothetical protein